METQYDDAMVTLRDGTVSIDGVKVAGSITFRRDPRLSHLAQALMDMPPIWRAPRQMVQVDKDSKWCMECGDTRPKSYFTAKRDTFDGLDPRCKACDAARKRKEYAEAVGHPVRNYARQEKAAV